MLIAQWFSLSEKTGKTNGEDKRFLGVISQTFHRGGFLLSFLPRFFFSKMSIPVSVKKNGCDQIRPKKKIKRSKKIRSIRT